MPDKPANRPQINIRLDKHPTLLDEIKAYASDRNTTASQFILDAIKTALSKPTTTQSPDTLSLSAILAEVDKLIDTKLDERLGEFEQRLLAEFRPNDRQPPPEELIEDIPETRPETRPDYQAIRDHILRSLRAKVATSSPQYRAVSRALDKFISELEEADPKVPPKE